MEGFLDLKRGLNTGEEEDERDVMATKSALQQSGDYQPPGGRISGWRDNETDQALKKVQVRNGLWPDGRMRVGGPTHRIINAEKRERETGKVENSIGLAGTVGRNAGNRPDDVRKWRGGLQSLGYAATHGANDQDFDDPLDWATRRFQTDYNLKPDGLVNPRGKTETIMARTVAPVQSARSRSPAAPKPVPVKSGAASGQQTGSKKVSQIGQLAGKVEEFWDHQVSQAERARGIMADNLLREMAKSGQSAGLVNAAGNLDHFRKGSGVDLQLTRDEARRRSPVQAGEARNRRYFEKSFLEDDFNSANYNDQLLKMRDGQELKLQPDKWEAATDAFDHLLAGDLDEHLASGTSEVESTAIDGFRAVRRGDTIHVFGTVEHRWDDKFDFGRRNFWNAIDPTEALGNVAREARDFGSAREYETHSGWLQQFRAEFRLVNGKLVPVDLNWHDIGGEGRLK